MPYVTEYVLPDLVVSYNHIDIYRVYKNDNYNDPMQYHYRLGSDDDEEDGDPTFDIRDLQNYEDGKPHETILRDAIANDWLTELL